MYQYDFDKPYDKLTVKTIILSKAFIFTLLPYLLSLYNIKNVIFIFIDPFSADDKKQLKSILANCSSLNNIFYKQCSEQNPRYSCISLEENEEEKEKEKKTYTLDEIIYTIISTTNDPDEENIANVLKELADRTELQKPIGINDIIDSGYKVALVVGQCGIGKSTLIKSLLKLPEGAIITGNNNTGVTKCTNIYTHSDKNVKLALIDTPGLECLNVNNNDVRRTEEGQPFAEYIVQKVKEYVEKGIKIDHVLYCIKAKDSEEINKKIKYNDDKQQFSIDGEVTPLFGYNHGRGTLNADKKKLILYDSSSKSLYKNNLFIDNDEMTFLERLSIALDGNVSEGKKSNTEFIFCCLQSKTQGNGIRNLKFLLTSLGLERKWFLNIADFGNGLAEEKFWHENDNVINHITTMVNKQYGYNNEYRQENIIFDILITADRHLWNFMKKNTQTYQSKKSFTDMYLNVDKISCIPINALCNNDSHESVFGLQELQGMILGDENKQANNDIIQQYALVVQEVKSILYQVFCHCVIEGILDVMLYSLIINNINLHFLIKIQISNIYMYITKVFYIYAYYSGKEVKINENNDVIINEKLRDTQPTAYMKLPIISNLLDSMIHKNLLNRVVLSKIIYIEVEDGKAGGGSKKKIGLWLA